METRAKLRAKSQEFGRPPVESDSEEDNEDNDERCDLCDKNIINGKGSKIVNIWVCAECVAEQSRTIPKVPKIDASAGSRNDITSNVVHDPDPLLVGSFSLASYASAFIIIVTAVIAYCGYSGLQLDSFLSLGKQQQLDCSNDTFLLEHFRSFSKKFPSQPEDTWFTFASGIKNIFITNPTEPTSFLLFHKNGDETANCLAKKLSEFASMCLTGNEDVIFVNSRDLQKEVAEDSGELINRYKDKVSEKSVMVVRDIDRLSGDVVKEFHYFCDTYQPLVRKAIYFFTMSTDGDVVEGKVIKNVEKSFRKTWESLEYSFLEPLIARMTDNLIPVVNEKSYSSYGC